MGMPWSLLERAIAREPRAVRELLGVLTPIIRARVGRVLLRRGAGRHRDIRQEVLDLSQQVFVALLEDNGQRLRSWDPARGMSIENFVGLIAEQQAAATFRNQGIWRYPPTEVDDLDDSIDSSRTPERITASKEALSTILSSVHAKLSERGVQLFHMLFIEERSIEEVCSVMEMNADAVYQWRTRLRRLVKQVASEVLTEATVTDVELGGGPQ
jgi:RNA polymerase sigma factor (sigma-70 family)